ncbi:MAG TPA: FtsX-like permease family protein [Anaerolineae bacterium]|nr:FtsX-like permease family protein [Anaerolineae bacterium]
MNPLSPLTYYRRHRGQALLVLALIGSLTLGVYVIVSLTGVSFATMRHSFHYLTRMSRLLASKGPEIGIQSQTSTIGTLDSGLAAQIRAHPDVAAVLPENGLYVGVPLAGMAIPTPVLGVTEADLPVVMEACALRLKAGRLIRPRTGEIVLSEEIARALDLTIGDQVSHKINADYYQTMATELTLVGILESVPSDAGPAVRAGFVSYEYLDGHELYQPRATNWLIIPRPGRRIAVNDFASTLIEESGGSSSNHLQSFESEVGLLDQVLRGIDMMYGFVNGLVAVAAALVVGMVHRIAVTHRLPELGLLHAAGYPRRNLVRRLVIEIAVAACVGWAVGLLCAHAFSILLSSTFFAAQGWSMNLANPKPLLSTLPIPLVVVAWINVSVRRTLNRLDPVAIFERGKLSMEGAGGRKQGKARSTSHPLSSWTFYLRHRRRSILLLAAIGLMVLGVALPGFLIGTINDSTLPLYLSYTTHATVVSPGFMYRAVAPDIVAQIRVHPAVAHAIPVKALAMRVNLPPGGELGSIPVYAVREQDLPILLNVYGLRLGEGDMVQPRSDQIILTGALARNRNLILGDAIGHPVHERDGMPTELTVVGLLDSTDPTLVERAGYDVPPMPRWAGFASYEYMDGHERYTDTPTNLLVIPVEGHEAEMEVWLEETIASPRVRIETLGSSYRFWQTNVQTAQATLAVGSAILSVVAGLGLAIMNYVFVTQRRDEFGALHAMGYSRAALIARTLRESVGIAVVAWLVGAAVCIAGMFYAQATLYTPLGTSLDWTNLAPWLSTLPIPLAVVVASAGTVTWTLSKLDPVAIIERR